MTNENTETEFFDNAIVQHIFQQRKTASDPGINKNSQFSSERSVITFQPDSLPTSPIETTSEPTFHDSIDRESFVVEGHVPTLMEDGPKSSTLPIIVLTTRTKLLPMMRDMAPL